MKSFFLSLCFLLTSCGYLAGKGDISSPISMNVPYVKGDKDGMLTAELICNVSSTGCFSYEKTSHRILRVDITDLGNEQIGYRRDRHRDGSIKKNVKATEGREKIAVNVSIYDENKGEVIWGPFSFQSDVDYDYVDQDSLQDLSFIDSGGNRQTVLAFSLGQLESIESAKDAALLPLYRSLAKKIAEALTGSVDKL